MSTELTIANLALGRLGVDRIASLSDTSLRANLVNDYIVQVRQEVLESYQWSFAMKRVELSENGTTPAFEWGFTFNRPSDFIRGVSEYNDEEWEEEGNVLLANAETLQMRYIAKTDDTTLYSPTFKKVWYLTLAAEMSYLLTQNKGLNAELKAEAEDAAMGSRSFNSMASSPKDFGIDSFTDVRL